METTDYAQKVIDDHMEERRQRDIELRKDKIRNDLIKNRNDKKTTFQQTTLNQLKCHVFMKQIFITFRVKHVEGLSKPLEFFGDKIVEEFGYANIILGREDEGDDMHLHGLIALPKKTKQSVKELENNVRDMIKKCYPDAKSNKCLQVKVAKSKTQATKYTLKEGDYFSSGFPKEIIEKFFLLSTQKTGIEKKIQMNEESYIIGACTFPEFAVRHLNIQVQHGQNIYAQHLKAYLTRFMLLNGYMSSSSYIEKLMEFE